MTEVSLTTFLLTKQKRNCHLLQLFYYSLILMGFLLALLWAPCQPITPPSVYGDLLSMKSRTHLYIHYSVMKASENAGGPRAAAHCAHLYIQYSVLPAINSLCWAIITDMIALICLFLSCLRSANM